MSLVDKKYLKNKNGEYFSPIYSLCSLKTKNDKLKIEYNEGKIQFTFTNPRDKSIIYFTNKGEVVCNTMKEYDENQKDYQTIAEQLAEQAWVDSGLSLDGTYTTSEEDSSEYEYCVYIRDSSSTVTLAEYLVNASTGEVNEEWSTGGSVSF